MILIWNCWYKIGYHRTSKNLKKIIKILRQAEKVYSNSSLYSDTKKWKCFKQKYVKVTKGAHSFKGYASTHDVEISNSFNSKIQLKDTEDAIKNKLKRYCLN